MSWWRPSPDRTTTPTPFHQLGADPRPVPSSAQDDSSDTDWVAFGYVGNSKTEIGVVATGTTGHAGLMEICTDDALSVSLSISTPPLPILIQLYSLLALFIFLPRHTALVCLLRILLL